MPDLAAQNGALLDYIISTVNAQIPEKRTRDTEIILSDLEEFMEYVIMVNASTAVGIGPGVEITISTLPDGKYSLFHACKDISCFSDL